MANNKPIMAHKYLHSNPDVWIEVSESLPPRRLESYDDYREFFYPLFFDARLKEIIKRVKYGAGYGPTTDPTYQVVHSINKMHNSRF